MRTAGNRCVLVLGREGMILGHSCSSISQATALWVQCELRLEFNSVTVCETDFQID